MVNTAATISVLLSPLQRKRKPELREIDQSIRAAAQAYVEMTTADRISALLASADNTILSGSPSTVYKKQTGHNKLSKEDIVNLFVKLGTDEERAVLKRFEQARVDFQNRLEDTDLFRFILKQAGIGRWTYYARSERPDLWTQDEILHILNILDKHQI